MSFFSPCIMPVKCVHAQHTVVTVAFLRSEMTQHFQSMEMCVNYSQERLSLNDKSCCKSQQRSGLVGNALLLHTSANRLETFPAGGVVKFSVLEHNNL